MKKILTIALAVLLIASIVTPVAAITPTLQVPKVPQISKIEIKVDLDEQIYENTTQKQFAEHPIQLSQFKFSYLE